MTVDNLFMIHGKVSVFPGFVRRGQDGGWFLNSINNKLTIGLLKK